MNSPKAYAASDLRAGLRAEFEREIGAADVTAFAELSGDWNPLHVDEAYARSTNYQARIAHGALQVALASTMAGMYLPGRDVVVGSFQCRFPAPLYFPARVRVTGEITSWNPQTGNGVLQTRVISLREMAVTAEIHTGFSLHEGRAVPVEERAAAPDGDHKPVVLVTGASGGLGPRIVSLLSETYRIVAVARSLPGPEMLAAAPGVEWVAADLTAADWEERILHHLGGRKLHGLIHAAWPGAPKGGLLDEDVEVVRTQVDFGGLGTVRVARFLRAAADGRARLVVLGSTAGTLKPVLNMAAYSLGKAVLEHVVRLLAPELARAEITINLVAPALVPAGMNAAKTAGALLAESAKVPLGRLCSPDDVARAVEFFLSPGAAFITGQCLPLTGGQL